MSLCLWFPVCLSHMDAVSFPSLISLRHSPNMPEHTSLQREKSNKISRFGLLARSMQNSPHCISCCPPLLLPCLPSEARAVSRVTFSNKPLAVGDPVGRGRKRERDIKCEGGSQGCWHFNGSCFAKCGHEPPVHRQGLIKSLTRCE